MFLIRSLLKNPHHRLLPVYFYLNNKYWKIHLMMRGGCDIRNSLKPSCKATPTKTRKHIFIYSEVG